MSAFKGNRSDISTPEFQCQNVWKLTAEEKVMQKDNKIMEQTQRDVKVNVKKKKARFIR